MRKPDWYAVAGTVAAVGLGLIWLWGMALCAQYAVWTHQAAQQALEAFR